MYVQAWMRQKEKGVNEPLKYTWLTEFKQNFTGFTILHVFVLLLSGKGKKNSGSQKKY